VCVLLSTALETEAMKATAANIRGFSALCDELRFAGPSE
jgi:hypothetical protein